MLVSKFYNYVYPLAKYLSAKLLVPIIQLMAWVFTSREVNRKEKRVLLVNSRSNYTTLSFDSLIPELKYRGVVIEYHLVDYSKLNGILKIKKMFYFFCQYKNADVVFLDDTFLPISFCLKGNWFSQARVVQLWHSCGLFKRTGLDLCKSKLSFILGKSNYRNYDLVSVSSESCRKSIAGFMGVDIKKVKALGVSRTDLYFDSSRRNESTISFEKKYPATSDKKVIIYAPTYRGQPFNVDASPIPIVSDTFCNLGNEYLPFIAPHPHEVVDNNVFSLNHNLSSILHLVDILITDYSSLAMEYMIANPRGKLILFVPDIAKYNHEVGFYVELETITNHVVTECRQLLKVIVEDSQQSSFSSYKDEYLSCCDGSSTKRLLQHLEL